MSYKLIYSIAVTAVYIGFVVKLIDVVITHHKTTANLIVESVILLCCVGAYWITMYGIKHGTLTPEKKTAG